MALSSGIFSLYTHNNQFYFNTENLIVSHSGDMPMFFDGANISSSEMNLYSVGHISTSGTLNTVIPTGKFFESSNLSLYIDNRVPDSGNISLYSFSAYLESGIDIDVYSRGVEFFPLYTVGGAEGRKWGDLTATTNLFLENVQPSGGSNYIIGEDIDLYIDAAVPTDYSTDFPLYIKSDNGFSSGVFPITVNSKILYGKTGHIGLYSNATDSSGVIGGIYESLGIFQMGYYGGNTITAQSFWKESSGIFPIYTETTERAMVDLYLKCGPFGSSGDINSYTICAYNSSGDIGVYVSSDNFERSGNMPIYLEAKNFATIPLYTYNYAEKSGDINMFLKGVTGTQNSNIPYHLYGNGVENTNISLYFHGF